MKNERFSSYPKIQILVRPDFSLNASLMEMSSLSEIMNTSPNTSIARTNPGLMEPDILYQIFKYALISVITVSEKKSRIINIQMIRNFAYSENVPLEPLIQEDFMKGLLHIRNYLKS